MVVDLATQQPTIKPIGDYLFARQGDSRRPLPIWFKQNGQPLALDGYVVEWAQTNADGAPLVVSGTTISGALVGQIVFYFPANAFAVAGSILGHFIVRKPSDGTVISSIDLSFDVKKDNVLMNLDTTPFMDDWERFKDSIRTQTETLKENIESFDSTIKGAKEQADAIELLVDSNQVAKKEDLKTYVSKDDDSTIAGVLTATDFKLNGESGLKDVLSGLRRLNGSSVATDEPLSSGLYKYDMKTWQSTTKPPYLSKDSQTGLIRASVIDEKNMIFEWLPSGWIQRQINGNWNNWTNRQGILIYQGTADSTSLITLEARLDAFSHAWVEVSYSGNHYFGWLDTSDVRFIVLGSKGQQTSLSVVGSLTSDKLGIQFTQFKSRSNGADTNETGTATFKIIGYKY